MSRRNVTIRRSLAMLAATAGAATAIIVGPATPAQAIPHCRAGYQCSYVYYSAADHETVVGGRTIFCDGSSDSFGVTSRYLEFGTAQCPDPL
ncbi:DUF6289 family protein [Micromonospora sp. NBC_01796]|uniref:DUF6289 family protein n=1 Tax=Micromonospora sp. NBC_01796 TaxID=2975987 RepID=UPI002DDAC2BA|nr:DUF6289 family protein [Micromonospora sp. NBC_01796]WSA85789.1 DUF6289 family protein [Micromonospora sp. NBC_01796]